MSLRNCLVCCLVLSACEGGQGGDPGQSMLGGSGGLGPDAGPGGPIAGMGDVEDGFCTGERWQAPDAPRRSGSCEEQAPGTFRCECGEGDAVTVDEDVGVARCADALREACEVDLRTPGFCEARAVGTCWPAAGFDADEPGWSCRCDGEEGLLESDAATCTDAISALCSERCESLFGSCVQAFWAPDSYGCGCTGETGAGDQPAPAADGGIGVGPGEGLVPTIGFASCAEALSTRCGERCETAAGSCAFDGEEAFDCSCAGGDEQRVALDELGGIEPGACGGALLAVCGEVLVASLTDCESSQDGHEAFCEALPRVLVPGAELPDSWGYRCACDGGEAQTLQAPTCHRALLAHCPDAIPSSAAPAEPGELGALCESADDCDLDACYVPGNQTDAICSARCEADDDCPDGALCAVIDPDKGGYCYATCESDIECGLRNDARDNPLYCADRVDIDQADLAAGDESGRVCVQGSEP